MPYIKQESREYYEEELSELIKSLNHQPLGDLNYIITRLILGYLGLDCINRWKQPSYAEYAGVIGTLIMIKDELERRKVDDYEDKKIKENGDVY